MDSMSLRRNSTPATSVFSGNQSYAEQLTRDLRDAVKRTVENVARNDKHTRQFLPKTDLDHILDYPSLQRLFEEILPEASFRGENDELVAQYTRATWKKPSRKSLLALFLYEDRKELLYLYLKWLDDICDEDLPNRGPSIPWDDSTPFTTETLYQYDVPDRFHGPILEKQAIFKPVTLQELKSHKLNNGERLPFIGRQDPIKRGSSGDVVRAEIAQCHWEIKVGNNFVTGNPRNPKVVALKTFKAVDGVRDVEEATQDFDIERKILSQLRNSKIKHDAILLDMGNITIFGDEGVLISHSLIFELANFSLGDYLKRQDLARQAVRPSRLLGNLVDVVEALSCLHDNLDTFHLDIKPDNILIFERHVGSESSSQYDLTWKLSDFGLARKKEARQRGKSSRASVANSLSSVPATRPAGLYQAPEIQEQNTSKAGRSSDVWSLGCVTLMVLALIIEGSPGVAELEVFLQVVFRHGGGKEPLFYVRNDSCQWEHRRQYEYCHLLKLKLEEDYIPGTGNRFQAALHPFLIHWFNMLLESCAQRVEQQFVLDILKIVFGEVLRIDRIKRLKASVLRKRLADIQKEWEMYELAPEDYSSRSISATVYPEETVSSLKPGFSPQKQPENPLAAQLPETRRYDVETPHLIVTGPQPTQPDIPCDLQQVPRAPILEQRNEFLEKLRDLIEQNDAAKVRTHLNGNPEALSQPCPGPGRYPIHWALHKNAYNALDALLEQATLEVTGIVCHGRTALDFACESGKPDALKCIREHRDKFTFSRDIYDKRKKHLGSEARKIVDDLFGIKRSFMPKLFKSSKQT